MRTPRREAALSVGLLLAMLAGLMLARWGLAGGFSRPLIPATPTPPPAAGAAPAAGRRLTTVALPHDAEPVAMVDGGVLVRDLRSGLAVRDLASGRERQRLGIDLTFVDATASLVAYVDDRGGLRLRDLATRRDRVVRPTGILDWFPLGRPVAGAGCCDQFGAFSPNGRHLAVYLQLRRPAQPGLAMVDVGRAEARPVPGSDMATPFGCQPCLGWSADGWLFFFSGGHRRMWSLPGGPAGRAPVGWTCRWTARPPSSAAAWRPNLSAYRECLADVPTIDPLDPLAPGAEPGEVVAG